TWRLDVTGTQAHSAGIFDPNTGAGAVFEAARILDAFYVKLHEEKYLTFNPSVINGGTDVTFDEDSHRGTASGKTNVVARSVIVTGDLRFLSNDQRDAAKETMRSIVAQHLPLTSATINFHDEYPAMSPTDGNYALLKVLDRASQDLGFGTVPALDPGERGAGDVSFVAPYVDSIDGIGARGDGSHTPDETVDLASLPILIKRTAIFIERLTR
ncbi:MAG: M20/M25/M40 family metallo-hydrolase, partial [Thermoanaerobaculia bacterium]